MALVVFFCSSDYDRDALAAEMTRRFAGVQVVGCTTAGEIGPAGCRDHSIAGVSFSADACTAVDRPHRGSAAASRSPTARPSPATCSTSSTEPRPGGRAENSFAFLLVDGLSVREELLAHALQEALGEIPLVGGSAGDGLSFGSTYVYSDGRFFTDSAVLALVTTPCRSGRSRHSTSCPPTSGSWSPRPTRRAAS